MSLMSYLQGCIQSNKEMMQNLDDNKQFPWQDIPVLTYLYTSLQQDCGRLREAIQNEKSREALEEARRWISSIRGCI